MAKFLEYLQHIDVNWKYQQGSSNLPLAMLTAHSILLEVDLESSPIHAACIWGNVDRVKCLVQADENAVNIYHEGYTAIHAAVLGDTAHSAEVIRVLLQHGADINAQTRVDEDTPLHLVVEHGEFPRDFSIVLLALEYGADLSVRNRKLRTAYDCAIGKGYFELASTLDGSMPPEQARSFYIQKMGEKYGPQIISSVLKNDLRQLEEGVRLGGDPNMLNKHGAGAIHYAVTHSSLPIMQVLRILIDAGADVNLRDEEGDNVLNLAIKSKKLHESGEMLEVVTFLCEKGADQAYKDLDGKDAYAMAEERGYEEVLSVLRKTRSTPGTKKVQL